MSRTTVTAAYEQLIAEGYLETRQGAAGRRSREGLAVCCAAGTAAAAGKPVRDLSAYGQRLADFAIASERDRERLAADFRYGDLAAADFPTLAWRKAVTAALLRRQPRLRYGDPPARRTSGRPCRAISGGPAGCAASRTRSSS